MTVSTRWIHSTDRWKIHFVELQFVRLNVTKSIVQTQPIKLHCVAFLTSVCFLYFFYYFIKNTTSTTIRIELFSRMFGSSVIMCGHLPQLWIHTSSNLKIECLIQFICLAFLWCCQFIGIGLCVLCSAFHVLRSVYSEFSIHRWLM